MRRVPILIVLAATALLTVLLSGAPATANQFFSSPLSPILLPFIANDIAAPTETPTFTPTPSPTDTPTFTPTPTTDASCSERVANGGFEQNAAWIFSNTPNDAGYSTADKYAGSRSGRFGLPPGSVPYIVPLGASSQPSLLGEMAPEGAAFSSGYQTISIPSTATKVTLTFRYNPGSLDTVNDFQRVLLLNPSNFGTIATLWKGAENDQVWKQRTFDLTAYRGQSLVLYFETYNNETSGTARTWMYVDEVSVQSCAAPVPTNTPTPTRTPTFTPSPTATPAGIYGRIFYKGAAKASITISLQRWNGATRTYIKSATTDSLGRYLFTNVPTLLAGQSYFVYFGVNSTNTNYVREWLGPDILSYTLGTGAHGGDFDIADVDLQAPPVNATVTVPATFSWLNRPVTGENYELWIFDPATGDAWHYCCVTEASSMVVNTLPLGIQEGRPYKWYVRVYVSPDSWGESFEARQIYFDLPPAPIGPASPGYGVASQPAQGWARAGIEKYVAGWLHSR